MARSDKDTKRLGLPEDPLLRLLAINGVAGIGIAILVLAGIFLTNIGNLRDLVLAADNPLLPVAMLGFGLVITLGSVVMGSAIMLLGDNDRPGGTPRRTEGAWLNGDLQPQPIPVSPIPVTGSRERR